MSPPEWAVTVVLILAVVAACGVVAGAVGRATRDRIVGSTDMPGTYANGGFIPGSNVGNDQVPVFFDNSFIIPSPRWLPATTPDEEAVRAHLREDWLHFADDYQSVLGEAWTDRTKGGQR